MLHFCLLNFQQKGTRYQLRLLSLAGRITTGSYLNQLCDYQHQWHMSMFIWQAHVSQTAWTFQLIVLWYSWSHSIVVMKRLAYLGTGRAPICVSESVIWTRDFDLTATLDTKWVGQSKIWFVKWLLIACGATIDQRDPAQLKTLAFVIINRVPHFSFKKTCYTNKQKLAVRWLFSLAHYNKSAHFQQIFDSIFLNFSPPNGIIKRGRDTLLQKISLWPNLTVVYSTLPITNREN